MSHSPHRRTFGASRGTGSDFPATKVHGPSGGVSGRVSIALILALATFSRAQIFVSPTGSDQNSGTSATSAFKTLEKARDHIRTTKLNQNLKADLVVYLRGGTYALTRPFTLTEQDGGSNGNRVVYKSFAGETPVLSGARSISGWTLHDQVLNVWKAVLPDSFETRQMFVNGVRAARARSVGGIQTGLPGCTANDTVVKTTDTAMARWKNPSDIELVYHQWFTNPRIGIDSMKRVGDTLRLVMKQPGYTWCRKKGGSSVQKPWYVENAYELLDKPGEWYLDRTGAVGGTKRTVYYIPRAGENMATADVKLPVLEQLVVAKGAGIDKPLRWVAFQGITFHHSTWLQPGGKLGHPDAQNNVIRRNVALQGLSGESIVPGAVHFDFATDILVRGCTFAMLGSTGLVFLNGAQRVSVEHSVFTDISGGGIHFGEVGRHDLNNYAPTDLRWEHTDNRVTDNTVTRIGVEYRSATAISAAYPVRMVIRNNEVGNVPYSGIHVGWGWIGAAGSTRQNLITHNDVYNTMQQIWDGMAIYTLGHTRNTVDSPSVISDNYVRGGIYNDEGSDRYFIANNVILNGGGNFLQWFANTPNNRADSNFVQLDKLAHLGPGNVITNTFVISPTYASMPAKARRIVDSAGPRAMATEPPTRVERVIDDLDLAGPLEVRILGADGRVVRSFTTQGIPTARELSALAGPRGTGVLWAVFRNQGRIAAIRPLLWN